MRRLLRIAIAILFVIVVLLAVASIAVLPTMRRLAATNHGKPFVDISSGRSIPPGVRIIRDIEFARHGKQPLKLDILRPKTDGTRPSPAVVWIHGGSFHKGSRNVFYSPLFKLIPRGFILVSIDYRLSQDAVFPAQVQDCKCAIRWIRAHSKEYGIDPRRIGACGGSAGGDLATFLGTSAGEKSLEGDSGWKDQRSDVQAVADYYGPTDLQAIPKGFASTKAGIAFGTLIANSRFCPISEFLGCSMWKDSDKCRAANPITYIRKRTAPFIILHGEKDQTVPLNQSLLLYEALKKHNTEAELVIIKNKGHEFSDSQADSKMIEFFTRHLCKQMSVRPRETGFSRSRH